MMINRTLRELTIEGLLMHIQGVETFVAEAKDHSAIFEVHNIAEKIAGRDHQLRIEVVALMKMADHGRAAMYSALDGMKLLFRSVLVRSENGFPAQIEEPS